MNGCVGHAGTGPLESIDELFLNAEERERCCAITRDCLRALQVDLAPDEGLFVWPCLHSGE